MSLPTQMTAHPSTTIPPPHLTGLAKLRWAVKNPPADPNVTFAGKTVLVTGANTGLGFEAAVKYAQKGCKKLILAVRSLSKGEAAKAAIIEKSNRPTEPFISILAVDLSSFPSVHAFATALEKEVHSTGLHIALLNAGLANPAYTKGTHAYDTALQVNVLGTALMAHLILPLLRPTGQDPPHLTFVNSFAHTEVQREWYAAPPSAGSLLAFANDADAFEQRKHYAAVKLLGMSVMQHFARTAAGRVVVNSCCPFFCRTNLGRNFGQAMQVVMGAVQYFTARSGEEGARTLVGATALGEESQGAFWHHDVLYPMGELAMDGDEMGKCWGEIWGVLEREGQVGAGVGAGAGVGGV
ncbi:NAD(P)-binding protein [Ophiobolus disseminans]|uniref:NAD(P)-binding protein n=1 Tax=Ophiobolus disseminans TaxID=1469910 RepID=A0A6A6ZEC4_9PLEO|nr:NAD(P)-binding protein [Ophiobolus disseminans]